MENWAFNQIDVYLTATDNVLGETSVVNNRWVPLSTYGILRGRMALTPSTVEGNQLSIPKRDGKTYSVDSCRGNAKLEFEILIADEWAHKSLNKTVRERSDIVMAHLNNAKRIAYKQPGRAADSYFLIYKTTLTVTDGDEKAYTIKASMEVHPFEFLFSGNTPVTIAANSSTTVNNALPLSLCKPSFVIEGTGSVAVSGTVSSIKEVPSGTLLDTFTGLVSNQNGSQNRNDYLDGDYEGLYIPQSSSVTVTNNFNHSITLYVRRGMVR